MNIKATLATALSLIAAQSVCGQRLEKMNWFNEPAQWNISGGKLSMDVTPQSDYWRISHYGFTVDDAPFYYAEYGGEFEAKVKVSGDYKVRFDQAGMMIRIDRSTNFTIATLSKETAAARVTVAGPGGATTGTRFSSQAMPRPIGRCLRLR